MSQEDNPLQAERTLDSFIPRSGSLTPAPLPLPTRRFTVRQHTGSKFRFRDSRLHRRKGTPQLSPRSVDSPSIARTPDSAVHNLTQQLGAAPGSSGVDEEDSEDFPDLVVGRGDFPIELPSNTANWTVSKWANQMGLTTFSPADEAKC